MLGSRQQASYSSKLVLAEASQLKEFSLFLVGKTGQ